MNDASTGLGDAPGSASSCAVEGACVDWLGVHRVQLADLEVQLQRRRRDRLAWARVRASRPAHTTLRCPARDGTEAARRPSRIPCEAATSCPATETSGAAFPMP